MCVSSCYLYNCFIHLPVLQVSKHVRMEAGRTTGTGIPAHHCGWETGMNISCAFLWAVFELCLYLVTILICFCNYVKVTILHFCSETKYSSFLKVLYCTPFWSFIWGFDVLKNICLQYKYQKPSQYIFTALFSGALVKTGRFVLSN